MDSAALPSLTPLFDGVDRFVELAPLLPVLVALEFILSADNAIALAAITKSLSDVELQRKALNIGISIALFLRIILILLADLVLKYWQIKLVASLYLIYLFINKLLIQSKSNDNITKDLSPNNSFFKIVIILSITDLAFSIDSVTTAVAISDQYLLVISGAIIGVIALRFTSGLFINWLEIFLRLEIAGYLAVAFVGIKLLLTLIYPKLILPNYIFICFIFIIFLWGFSKKKIIV